MISCRLRLIALIAARSHLPTCRHVESIKPNLAKTSHFWAFVAMGISASLHMGTLSSIRCTVAIFIRQRNAKTSGKKDTASMEYAASFFTPNAQKDPANKTIHNTTRESVIPTLTSQQNLDS